MLRKRWEEWRNGIGRRRAAGSLPECSAINHIAIIESGCKLPKRAESPERSRIGSRVYASTVYRRSSAPHMSPSAKLTPPRLGDTHPRERLFARLDEARTGASVWITGLPGAGKTTLMASYVQSRKLPALWYQVDAGDSDPATLFYALRGAASAKRGAPLPLLTPAYMRDVEGFARRFFRVLFERMQRPAVVVFDNFHEVAAGDALHAIVRTAMAEAPPGINVAVISREGPSAAFARLAANGQLATMTWEDLRLSADESAAIVALHSPQAVAQSAQLHQRAGG